MDVGVFPFSLAFTVGPVRASARTETATADALRYISELLSLVLDFQDLEARLVAQSPYRGVGRCFHCLWRETRRRAPRSHSRCLTVSVSHFASGNTNHEIARGTDGLDIQISERARPTSRSSVKSLSRYWLFCTKTIQRSTFHPNARRNACRAYCRYFACTKAQCYAPCSTEGDA